MHCRAIDHLLPIVCATVLLAGDVLAQTDPAPPKQGAALLKTDIMGVFAHPDDETGTAATLAYHAHGRGAVVANIYCTRGEGGGNMVGTQSGASLGTLREAELRDCLAVLGVRYCYFLDQLDWAYTESAAATLQKWGKEETLERLVRFVRALRPEIIVTMNPAPTPGQHGHHQAAGILATEAFSAAADPSRFPLQLSREGLTVWQPRRLYFRGVSGDAVTTIGVTDPLPDGRTPAQLAAQALAHHRSQAFGNIGSSPWLQRPQTFTLVKSMVPLHGIETNLLAGLPQVEIDPDRRPMAKPVTPPSLELEFVPRPAFANYRRWVKEQGIEHVAGRFRANLPLVAGEPNEVKLQIANARPNAVSGELSVAVPAGWSIEPARLRIEVPAQRAATVAVKITPPAAAAGESDLSASLVVGEQQLEAVATGQAVPRLRVARSSSPPSLDGTDAGWEHASPMLIPSTNLAQGKADDDGDSSARVRLTHDGRTLFIDAQVRDQTVVSNIAPDDIKGHWRSDSVEICLDPAAGAEHTLGCYKLGIFPFDSTGVVRAARDADANQGPMEETAPGTRVASWRTPDGYRIQAAIPFAEIGFKQGPKRLGFNLIVYDGDKRDAAPGENINESRIAWAPVSGVQGRPEDWGRIDLE